MNAIALVIGNTNYKLEKHVLPNAAKDAIDVSEKLVNLGFTVDKHTDCDILEFQRAIQLFSAKRKKFAVGLFYFAGHGLQIKGKNFLTAIDTRFEDETAAEYSSCNLSMILDYMDTSTMSENSVNIVILDACRDNPWNLAVRSVNNHDLAPVFAPKGTLIAYSTSPGQTADDGEKGGNSIYAKAFLNHIDDEEIPIEDFFKRVRTSVYAGTNGSQTSWEHTSLIGDFYFNSRALNHSVNLPYEDYAIADQDFISDGSNLQEIILQMRTHDYYSQRPALKSFKSMNAVGNDNISDLFLIGRNILQSAHGGEGDAKKFMNSLSFSLPGMATNEENHVLNGILFEMYFNKQGRFRQEKFKNDFLDEIYSLEEDGLYPLSFNMIAEHVMPFKNYVFYKAGDKSVPIEVRIEDFEFMSIHRKLIVRPKLVSIKYKGKELMENGNEDEESEWNIRAIYFTDLKRLISKLLMIPLKKLRLSVNVNILDNDRITVPDIIRILK
ncbi:caspase family protein [Pedobacter frigiditerrae]|uniref:Caspase family protein n=1 Tax=Pedobacter frigiditerrae TaxID=2530452 RepID=A0A4R0MQW2_9SPHI|nr:caspase family protein [Pedobacter frigiditerrae]TCC88662.1 caspase family protein [Pedobacter frigiditerrae]